MSTTLAFTTRDQIAPTDGREILDKPLSARERQDDSGCLGGEREYGRLRILVANQLAQRGP